MNLSSGPATDPSSPFADRTPNRIQREQSPQRPVASERDDAIESLANKGRYGLD
jgi:hypothetical protein